MNKDITMQHAAPLSIGHVALTVHDLDAVSDFYLKTVGLHLLSRDAAVARLGAGGKMLLELRRDTAAARHAPGAPGLYHTAFLLPTRADLGSWLQYAGAHGIQLQGAADHLVSEAVYLADPEGNGIEIYADRPRAAWPLKGGAITMANEKLDFAGILNGATGPWRGFPENAVVGHVHLQVGNLAAAEAFYGDGLGFEIYTRFPGATFLGAGGYHHHIGANIWHSEGARPAAGPRTGLAGIEIIAAGESEIAGIRQRLGIAAAAAEPAVLSLQDPWGIPLLLAVPKI